MGKKGDSAKRADGHKGPLGAIGGLVAKANGKSGHRAGFERDLSIFLSGCVW
jgi:hypothetical protein